MKFVDFGIVVSFDPVIDDFRHAAYDEVFAEEECQFVVEKFEGCFVVDDSKESFVASG